MTAIDLYSVLHRAWDDPFHLKGNFARENALEVACAASLGHITNQSTEDSFSNRWHITAKGWSCLRAESLNRSKS